MNHPIEAGTDKERPAPGREQWPAEGQITARDTLDDDLDRDVEVTILNRQRQRRVDTRELSSFLIRLAARAPSDQGDRLGVSLVSDDRMRRYNRDYRSVDHSTDVLAFPGDATPVPEGGHHLGDIVISVPRAAEQARRAGHGLDREIKVLLIHGYLHLLGYDHESDDGAMMRLQSRLVRSLLPRRSASEG